LGNNANNNHDYDDNLPVYDILFRIWTKTPVIHNIWRFKTIAIPKEISRWVNGDQLRYRKNGPIYSKDSWKNGVIVDMNVYDEKELIIKNISYLDMFIM